MESTIFANSLPSNSVGYMKQVDGENITYYYICYPGRIGVTIEDPLWQIQRCSMVRYPNGTMDCVRFEYPEGSTDYRFSPSNMENYNYKFTNT